MLHWDGAVGATTPVCGVLLPYQDSVGNQMAKGREERRVVLPLPLEVWPIRNGCDARLNPSDM